MVVERRLPGPVSVVARDHGGPGPSLLCLHGLASNSLIFDAMAEALAADHHVVAYDQRGHGLSGDPVGGDYSFGALCADARTVVDGLELGPHVVVGHSWGASVALHHAARSTDCVGVVCIDGGVHSLGAMSWEDAQRRLRPPHLEGPAEALLARIRAGGPALPWDRWEPVLRRSFIEGDDGVMRRRTPIPDHMKIVRSMWEDDPASVYARIEVPVLVLLASGLDGASTPFLEAKRTAADALGAAYAHVRVDWLASVHDMPLLHPLEVADRVSTFVVSVR